jgi:hypothetical protein
MAVKFQGGKAVPVSTQAFKDVQSALFKVRDQAKAMYKKGIPNAQEAEMPTAFYYVSEAIRSGDADQISLAFNGSIAYLAKIQQMQTMRAYDKQIGRGPAVDAEWAKLLALMEQLRSAIVKAGVRLAR